MTGITRGVRPDGERRAAGETLSQTERLFSVKNLVFLVQGALYCIREEAGWKSSTKRWDAAAGVLGQLKGEASPVCTEFPQSRGTALPAGMNRCKDPGVRPRFFPWTPVLTRCCPFTQDSFASHSRFFPHFFLVLCRSLAKAKVLDTSIAWFCWLST